MNKRRDFKRLIVNVFLNANTAEEWIVNLLFFLNLVNIKWMRIDPIKNVFKFKVIMGSNNISTDFINVLMEFYVLHKWCETMNR